MKKIWHVVKEMYEVSKSAVLLDGKSEQGVAQGCSLSPILFSVFINDLLKAVEKAGLRVQLYKHSGMLFVDDFVEVSDSWEKLRKLIDGTKLLH